MENIQNIFGTDGVRGIPNQGIFEPQKVCRLGVALGQYLRKRSENPIVLIGKDTRISCYMIEYLLAGSLTSQGVDVYLTGPIPTGGISYLCQSMRVDMGVVVSASHNSFEYNGVKLLDSQGIKLSEKDELEISDLFTKSDLLVGVSPEKLGRIRRLDDGIWRYLAFLKSFLPRSLNLKGLKIALDCANGAAYMIAPKVFWELGAEIVTIGCEPNGFNINHEVGSLHPEALQKVMAETSSDVGFCFDGDADRLIVVTPEGKILNGDTLLAIFARFRKYIGVGDLKGVVGTVLSNRALEDLVKKEGLIFKRAAVGDKNILTEMQKNQFVLGGEESGHVILLHRAFCGDGLITALAVLEIMLKASAKIDRLADIYSPFPSVLTNFDISNKSLPSDFWGELEDFQRSLTESLGVRSVIRKSGTENKLRAYLEAEDESILAQASVMVSDFLKKRDIYSK